MVPMLSTVWLSCVGVLASGVMLATDMKERPVMKVVRLLQDMKAQLDSEMADDKAVHEQLACWCKNNDQQKTRAIEQGEADESRLEAFLGEAAAKMAEMKTKRDAALAEADRDFDALEQARAMRMKQNQEFHGSEANLIEAVKALDQAIAVLKEYHPNAAGLQQVRAVARHLQTAQVVALGKRLAGGPTGAQMAALEAFLSQAQAATSFLAIPGYQSYAPQSGQIFGVLEQMREDFDKDLSDAQKKELKDAADFKALKAAKEEEIAAGRALVAELDGNIADLRAKHASAFKELEDTQAQLALDRTFLANLKQKCSETDAEFEQRVKDRLTEIAAVDDTIKILNEDTSFDNFEKTVNTAFLQAESLSEHQETAVQQQRLYQVALALQGAAAKLGEPQLALLATRAHLDAFTKVKELIDKMVAELTKQQEDEVAHRDWCIDEFASNKRATSEAYDRKESLLATIADLDKSIEILSKDIEATVSAVAEMQEQMKRASEIREAENHDYQVTVDDQRMTQTILSKALTRMQEVYALMQEQPGAAHVHTSGTHTDPGNGPARFTKYGKNVGGARVVQMLQTVLSDSKKMEEDAIAAEQDAQSVYENFMKNTNAMITAATKKLVNMRKSKATADEERNNAQQDLKATVGKLEELHQTNGDLKASCDFLLKNFDARQAARTAEMNSLNEAKAILSGAE